MTNTDNMYALEKMYGQGVGMTDMQKAVANDKKNQLDTAARSAAESVNKGWTLRDKLTSQVAYEQGLADKAMEVANMYQPTRNADQYGATPQGVNVSNEEVAAIKAMGLPMTMDSVMQLRTPTANADQMPQSAFNGIGR